MAKCTTCGKTGFGFLEVKNGMCPTCRKAMESVEAGKTDDDRRMASAERKRVLASADNLTLTTETTIGEVERLGVVAAEVVLGMNIFKDVLVNIRDIFGGRSGTVQDTLEEARLVAFAELRLKAAELGADTVVAISIDYHSISTGSAVNGSVHGRGVISAPSTV